jgi:hypothetical protein
MDSPRPVVTIEHRLVPPSAVPSRDRSVTTEESRAFLQERLALFAKVAFVLSSGFFAFASVVAAHRPSALPWIGAHPLNHLASNVVLLLTWLACLHKKHPIGRLRALEANSVFLYCLFMAASVADVPSAHPGAKYSMLLTLTSVLIGRAVLVPGTATRTLGLSTACVLPALAASWTFDTPTPPPRSTRRSTRSSRSCGAWMRWRSRPSRRTSSTACASG